MKNVFLTIFIFTTILATGIAIYFVIENMNINKQLLENKSNIENYNTENSAVEKKQDEDSEKIDVSKNLQEGVYLSKTFGNIKTKIQDGKAYIAFTSKELGSSEFTKELNKYYEILNVSGNVIDISMIKMPTSGYPIFILLMEDGTIQKTKFVQGSDIICDGKIDGFENIERIDEIEIVNNLEFGNEKVVDYSIGVVATDNNGKTKQVKIY